MTTQAVLKASSFPRRALGSRTSLRAILIKEAGFFLDDSFQGEMATDHAREATAQAQADEKQRGIRGSQRHGSEGAQAAEGCRSSLHPRLVRGSGGTSAGPAASVWHRATHSSAHQCIQITPGTSAPKTRGKTTWMQDKKILIQKSLQGSTKPIVLAKRGFYIKHSFSTLW